MKVLAEANANAAISILHALGLGKGCSIGINLKTTVRLVSEPQKVEGDFHNLLQTIEDIMRALTDLTRTQTLIWKKNI